MLARSRNFGLKPTSHLGMKHGTRKSPRYRYTILLKKFSWQFSSQLLCLSLFQVCCGYHACQVKIALVLAEECVGGYFNNLHFEIVRIIQITADLYSCSVQL